jgi:hypothetical protein
MCDWTKGVKRTQAIRNSIFLGSRMLNYIMIRKIFKWVKHPIFTKKLGRPLICRWGHILNIKYSLFHPFYAQRQCFVGNLLFGNPIGHHGYQCSTHSSKIRAQL